MLGCWFLFVFVTHSIRVALDFIRTFVCNSTYVDWSPLSVPPRRICRTDIADRRATHGGGSPPALSKWTSEAGALLSSVLHAQTHTHTNYTHTNTAHIIIHIHYIHTCQTPPTQSRPPRMYNVTFCAPETRDGQRERECCVLCASCVPDVPIYYIWFD